MAGDFDKAPSAWRLRSLPQSFQSLRYVIHFLLLLIEPLRQIIVTVSQYVDLASNIIVSLEKQGTFQAPYRRFNGNLRSVAALSDANLLSINYISHTLSSSFSISISNFK